MEFLAYFCLFGLLILLIIELILSLFSKHILFIFNDYTFVTKYTFNNKLSFKRVQDKYNKPILKGIVFKDYQSLNVYLIKASHLAFDLDNYSVTYYGGN